MSRHSAAVAEFAISTHREHDYPGKLHDSDENGKKGLHSFYTGIFVMIFSLEINAL
jgi:hypothetical protein